MACIDDNWSLHLGMHLAGYREWHASQIQSAEYSLINECRLP